MNKKISILITSILFFLIFGSYLVTSESAFSKSIKGIFPNNLKFFLKETVFIIPNLKKENKKILKKLEIISNDLQVLKTGNKKMLGLKIIEDPFEKKLDTKKFTLIKFFLFGDPHDYAGYQKAKFYKGRYIEKFNQNIILLDSLNFYSSFIDDNILNLNRLNLEEISSNIKNFNNLVGIRDTKIINDEIYLFGIFKNDDCYDAQILNAKIKFNKVENNFEKLILNTFFEFNICGKNPMQSGGRIEKYNDKNLIVSVGDFGLLEWDKKEEKFLSDNNNLGKIIKINLLTKKKIILSKGHRNPQGLIYLDEKNIIVNTEHRPKGGDEINVNLMDKIYNFGWPIASYGIRYNGENPFKQTHKNFDEPIKYYTPSVAPSQIIKKFDEDALYFATLKDKSIYEIKLTNDFKKILSEERFFINERIRDIIHIKNGIYSLVLDNSPSLAFFELKK